ncbi:hypothetical protein D3C72_2533070 [compost metagenome]
MLAIAVPKMALPKSDAKTAWAIIPVIIRDVLNFGGTPSDIYSNETGKRNPIPSPLKTNGKKKSEESIPG